MHIFLVFNFDKHTIMIRSGVCRLLSTYLVFLVSTSNHKFLSIFEFSNGFRPLKVILNMHVFKHYCDPQCSRDTLKMKLYSSLNVKLILVRRYLDMCQTPRICVLNYIICFLIQGTIRALLDILSTVHVWDVNILPLCIKDC